MNESSPAGTVCPAIHPEGMSAQEPGAALEGNEMPASPLRPPGRLTALRIAVWGGVGAGVGRVVWDSTFEKAGPVHWHRLEWIGFALAAILVVVWEMRIQSNLEARIEGKTHSRRAHASRGLRKTLLATLQAFIFVFAVEMIFELVHGPLRQDPAAFFRTVLIITLIAGAITYLWVRCAQRQLGWALLSGPLTGFMVSYVAEMMEICFWPSSHLIPNDRLLQALASWRLHLVVGLNALAWASWGLMGAIAVNRKWGRCPSLGILASMLVVDPIWTFIYWAWFGHELMQRETIPILLLGTFRTLFWGMGLYLCPGAETTLVLSPVSRSRFGTAVAWGLAVLAALLCGILVAAKIRASHGG